MPNLNQSLEKELRIIEKEVVDVLVKIGEIRGQPSLISRLTSYLFIRGNLTQKQLKYLTGYSLSTISPALFTLTNIGLVNKEYIEGTHTILYSLVQKDVSQDILSAGMVKLKEIGSFLELLEEKRNLLSEERYFKKSGSALLRKRISSLIMLLKLLLSLLRKKSLLNEGFKTKTEESLEDFYEIQQFNYEITVIENDIRDFFINSSIFLIQKKIFSKFLFYFITRKVLTQAKLRELTGFSAGKVSKEINFLLKRGLIEIVERTKRRTIIYTMKSVKSAFFTILTNAIGEMLKLEEKMIKIKKKLKKRKEKLQLLEGFKDLEMTINFFLNYFNLIKILSKRITQSNKK